jgi:hypothetical protein
VAKISSARPGDADSEGSTYLSSGKQRK